MAIGIPEYRLPRDVLQEEIARILAVGVELRLDTAMGRDFGLADLEREGFKAIFLATGASKSRRLGVPGDELRGVIPATLFLKEVNLGESPRLSGDVVVVGGGSTAMDAARSAPTKRRRQTVTIVYRRGRRDMPAQARGDRGGRARGHRRSSTAWRRPRSSDATASVVALRCDVLRADEAPGADGRATWSSTGETRELPATRDPGRDRRGARSVDPPRGRRHRGQRLGRHRRRSADPRHGPGRASSPAATSSPARDDHRGGRRRPSRRRVRSTSTSRAPADGEAEILAAVRYPTAPERVAHGSTSPRGRAIRAALPVVDIRLVHGHGVRASTRPTARAEAGRCFRCDAVYGCPSVQRHRRPGPGGRRPRRQTPPAMPRPGGRRPPTSQRREVCSDRRPGLRLLRRRRGVRRGHDRGGARRPVDPRRGAPPRAARTWSATTGKFTLRLGADLWWIIYVALRDIILLQVFLGSFIFLYPDVVTGQDLPDHRRARGRLRIRRPAIKLMTKGDADVRWHAQSQVILIGLGRRAVPRALPASASQMTLLNGNLTDQVMPLLVTLQEPRPRTAAVLPVGAADRRHGPGRRGLQPRGRP